MQTLPPLLMWPGLHRSSGLQKRRHQDDKAAAYIKS